MNKKSSNQNAIYCLMWQYFISMFSRTEDTSLLNMYLSVLMNFDIRFNIRLKTHFEKMLKKIQTLYENVNVSKFLELNFEQIQISLYK